jgi:hypothetical protein
MISWPVPILTGVDVEELAEETRHAFDAAYDGADVRPILPPPISYWSELLGCEVSATLSAAMFQHAQEVMKFRHTTPSAYTPR